MLTLDFNFDALHARLSGRITLVLERAILAVSRVDSATDPVGLVPGVQGATIPPQLPTRPIDEVRPETSVWLVGCALRDCLEEVGGFLEETRRLCAALEVVRGRDRIVVSDLAQAVEADRLRFDRRGFPDKVDYLRQTYGDVLDDRVAYILTLNAARNCLVHRLGLVGDRDRNEGDHLVLRWQSPEVHVKPKDGEQRAVQIPEVVPGGSQLLVQFQLIERRYAVGDQVRFNTTDLAGIWLTLHLFAVGTARKVLEMAKARGVGTTEAAARDGESGR